APESPALVLSRSLTAAAEGGADPGAVSLREWHGYTCLVLPGLDEELALPALEEAHSPARAALAVLPPQAGPPRPRPPPPPPPRASCSSGCPRGLATASWRWPPPRGFIPCAPPSRSWSAASGPTSRPTRPRWWSVYGSGAARGRPRRRRPPFSISRTTPVHGASTRAGCCSVCFAWARSATSTTPSSSISIG